MNSLFEDLCTGLQEAIDFEKGIRTAKKIISGTADFICAGEYFFLSPRP